MFSDSVSLDFWRVYSIPKGRVLDFLLSSSDLNNEQDLVHSIGFDVRSC